MGRGVRIFEEEHSGIALPGVQGKRLCSCEDIRTVRYQSSNPLTKARKLPGLSILRRLPCMMAPNLLVRLRIGTTVEEFKIFLSDVLFRVTIFIYEHGIRWPSSPCNSVHLSTFDVRLHPFVISIDNFLNSNFQPVSASRNFHFCEWAAPSHPERVQVSLSV